MEKLKNFIKFFGISLGILSLYIMLSLATGNLLSKYIKSPNFLIANFSGILSELIVLFVLIIIYRKRLINDFKNLKNNSKEIMNISFKNWIIGLIIMFVSNIIINLIIGNIANNEELNRELLISMPIYAIVAMVFIAPIIEEIVFRLSPKFAFTKRIPYIFYSGLLFGAMHLVTSSSLIELLYIIPYSALGIAFANSVYETDNIFASIITHVIHNALAVIVAYIALLG